jgi:ABC-type transport system substrate-binding protein
VDEIEFYPIQDYNTKYAAWVTGKVHHIGHGSSGMTKAQVAQTQKNHPSFTIHIVNYNHISQLPLNPLRPPMDNWKVRWAIHLALDRGDWNSFNTVGDIKMSTPMYFLHPVSPWGVPYEKFKNEPGFRADKKDADIAEANRLLDEVFGKGIRPTDTEITIWSLLSRREIGVWALDQFRESLGWELAAKFVERGDYSRKFADRTYVIQPNAAPTHGMSNQSDPGIAFLAVISDPSVGTNFYFYDGWRGQGEGKDWAAEKARIDDLTWELVYTLNQNRRQELTTYLERYYVEERTTVPMLGSMNVAWGTRPEMKGSYFAGIGTGANWPLRDRWWLTK